MNLGRRKETNLKRIVIKKIKSEEVWWRRWWWILEGNENDYEWVV